MSRGHTLLELMVALALLVSLAVGAVGWTQTALRAGDAASKRLRWEAAARATLDLIGDDLATGDFPIARPDGHEVLRVFAQGNELSIRARKHAETDAASWRVFLFDEKLSSLSVGTRISAWSNPAPSGAAPMNSRPLLSNVALATWTIDAQSRTLAVRVESTWGQAMTRSYIAP